MDDSTHRDRGIRGLLAGAIGIIATSMLCLIGTGTSWADAQDSSISSTRSHGEVDDFAPALATSDSGPRSATVRPLADLPGPADLNRSLQEPESTSGASEVTDRSSDQEHRFLSPGLLGLAGLVIAAVLGSIFLMIRSRLRSRTRQETEQ